MTAPDLTRAQGLHLALHNLIARSGIDGLQPLTLRPDGQGWLLGLRDGQVHVPSALLWRSYRRGWAARLDRLAREFALDRAAPFGRDETVIDVGANVGDFSAAALRAGAGRVLAVEGDPVVAECLRRNHAHAPQVSVERAILWCEPAEITFYSAPGRADSSIFLPPGESLAAFRTMATTLDIVAEAQGVGAVGLLKMDAEGAEPEVLQGAAAVLARTRMVAIDTGPERNGARTDAACIDILRAAGFRIADPGQTRRMITIAIRD